MTLSVALTLHSVPRLVLKSGGFGLRVPFRVRYSHDGFLTVGIYLNDMPMLHASYDILFSRHVRTRPFSELA
jgi:hypothetical protein